MFILQYVAIHHVFRLSCLGASPIFEEFHKKLEKEEGGNHKRIIHSERSLHQMEFQMDHHQSSGSLSLIERSTLLHNHCIRSSFKANLTF